MPVVRPPALAVRTDDRRRDGVLRGLDGVPTDEGDVMLIAVDFDGTIVEHRFPDIGSPCPGAFHWMKEWQAAGAKLILWTMRSDGRTGEGRESGPVLTEAVEFCRKNGVEFHAVNENPSQKSWTQSPKCYAHLYVDDAAFGCPLRDSFGGGRPMVDWAAVGPHVLDMIRDHQRAK